MPGRKPMDQTDIDTIMSILGDRLNQGSPQGPVGGKTGAKYGGYNTVTEEKQAITGLGQYRQHQAQAAQQMLTEAAAQGAQWDQGLAAHASQHMRDAYANNEQVGGAIGQANFDAMAANYAGASAQDWKQKHPGQVDTSGSVPRYTGGEQDPGYEQAAQMAGAQQVTDARLIAPTRQRTSMELAKAQEQVGVTGGQSRQAYEAFDAQRAALDDLLYGSETPYDQQAAIEIGVDPLVAAGMYQDTPSDQIATYTRGRDLRSLNDTGMLYSEAQAAKRTATADQATADKTDLDNFVEQATGLASSAAQSRSGLTADEIASIAQDPHWAQLVQTQDSLLADAQAGDTQALTDLDALLSASDLTTNQRRLLRARMTGLGITDTELANAGG